MDIRRAALVLAVVGVVLLPGVGYVYAYDSLDGPQPHREPTSYVTEPMDVSNDTVMADRYGGDVAFFVPQLEYRHVGGDFRARNETREVLVRAMETGNATTTNESVSADLQSIRRNYSFVDGGHDGFYRLSLSVDGGQTVVTATPANDTAVAAEAREEVVVAYDSLSPEERRTFEKIRDASGEDAFGYRPWSNESVPYPPTVVEEGGEHYAVVAYAHVDDFNFPDGVVLGVAASGLGVLSLLGAGVLGLVLAVRS
ncbi:MAG: hypothetical protein ABEJ22_09655 [Haloferacaceae archaeon]